MVYQGEKKYGSFENHPLYIELKKINVTNEKALEPVESGKDKAKHLEEELTSKRQKKCDEIFAEYLGYIAQNVKEAYYKEALKFVLLYRECLNHYHSQLSEGKKKLPDILAMQPPAAIKGESKTEFCLENNAEQVPDISNEFLAAYLPKTKVEIKQEDSKELTYHLCCWLFLNTYTCSIVSFAPPKGKD